MLKSYTRRRQYEVGEVEPGFPPARLDGDVCAEAVVDRVDRVNLDEYDPHVDHDLRPTSQHGRDSININVILYPMSIGYLNQQECQYHSMPLSSIHP